MKNDYNNGVTAFQIEGFNTREIPGNKGFVGVTTFQTEGFNTFDVNVKAPKYGVTTFQTEGFNTAVSGND